MATFTSFSSFQSAYISVLADLYYSGTLTNSSADQLSVGSQFGTKERTTKEILLYSFTIEDPRDRAIFLVSRQINLSFAVANSIWMLTGSDELEFINFYNQRGASFSDDGAVLHGAHGKRLFDADGINQIKGIVERLKRDPYSRRTVAVIYHPKDSVAPSRDIPCTIGIQFLQRQGKLHAITFMRSQSVAMVLPYDVFAFTFLQEAIAVELGLQIGTYHHVSSSFHYYLDEEDIVKSVVKHDVATLEADLEIPAMPSGISPFQMVESIIQFENTYRKDGVQKMEFIAHLPVYWKQIAYILAVKIANQRGDSIESLLLDLPLYYRRFFLQQG